MYQQVYIYYNNDRNDVLVTDDYKRVIKPLINKNCKNYHYKKYNRIIDLVRCIKTDTDYNNIRFDFTDLDYLQYLKIDQKEVYNLYVEIAKEMKRKHIKEIKANNIDAFVEGRAISGFPIYCCCIENSGKGSTYSNIITEDKYINLTSDYSLLAEAHAMLKITDFAIKNNKSVNIWYSNISLTNIVNEKEILKMHKSLGEEFRNQVSIMKERAKEKKLNINYHYKEENGYYKLLNERFNMIEPMFSKIYTELFDLEKTNRRGVVIGEELKPFNKTVLVPRRIRELKITGIYRRESKFTFSGNELYIYNDNYTSNKINEQDILMLIVLCPDIQYKINQMLYRIEKENYKLSPRFIENMENDRFKSFTRQCNLDYLTDLVLRKAPFLITSDIGLVRHNVINITEAIPLINTTEESSIAYCMRFLTPLLMVVPRVNNRFIKNDKDKYYSISVPITIENKTYKLISKRDGYQNKNTSSYWYHLNIKEDLSANNYDIIPLYY